MTSFIPKNLSVQALRQAYLNQEIEPKALIMELREQALAQAEFNAWITILDEAQIEAYLQRLDGKTASDLPLFGIPFAIKDNIDLAGVPTTAACPDFEYTPDKSATVVQHLIDAGAIPLGKTNLDQFATGLVGTRSPYGEGKNVFNQDYISGGSSAGSAIATALGQVSFALGTDTAGSGRVPAAINNLIGHKPSKGLFSMTGVVPACLSLDCVSVFALNCDDAALIFDVAAQYDPQYNYSEKNNFANRYRYYQANDAQPFRFAVPDKLEFQGDAETHALFEQTVTTLKSLGGTAVSVDFSPFFEAAKLLYEGPWVAERWLATQNVSAESMLPVIAEIIKNADTLTATSTFDAQYRLATLKQASDLIVDDVDFVLTPTTPTVFTREQINSEPIVNNSILGTYTNFMNLLDYCATAVPVGFCDSGVSWGVTLFGARETDVRLLAYANRLQRKLDLPQGATSHSLTLSQTHNVPEITNHVDVVVCGAHLQGQLLNWQLTERGGQLVSETTTSKHYQLFALSDGIRPALVRTEGEGTQKGTQIAVEVWRLPSDAFGSFVTGIPAPLGIGKVELENGSWISGFICDYYGLASATDITSYGGWVNWLDSQ